jgi:hypothetical protein
MVPMTFAAQYFRLTVTEEVLSKLVEKDDITSGIHFQNNAVGVLDQMAVFNLALTQIFLRDSTFLNLPLQEPGD